MSNIIKKLNLALCAAILVFGLFVVSTPAAAQTPTPTPTSTTATPTPASAAASYDTSGGKKGLVQCGNGPGPGADQQPCTVEDIFNIFVIATNLLVGLVGLFAIFSIFRAGFDMVLSVGNTEGTTKAKKSLTNALLGLTLVLVAFMLINVLVYGLIGATGTNILSNPLGYIGLVPATGGP